ncbi:MAG: hypothetical protein DRH08_09885 [Deltaproteobacteria bacterium]|nr:MAG: hypothetical protein DRH08_09885 [Deltaproteobacteria bacterium]
MVPVGVAGTYIKIGFFHTGSDLLNHDEIHDDLFSQLEKTLELLYAKYLRAGISYEGLQRIEMPVPRPVMREALINAEAIRTTLPPSPFRSASVSTN